MNKDLQTYLNECQNDRNKYFVQGDSKSNKN